MSAQLDQMFELGRAQHCLVHGDLRGALDIYKVLLEARPDDMRMQERFAALLREDGQLDAARILYRMIARHWKKEGFYLRAVTNFRILVELEPSDLSAKRHLAELYAEMNLVERATEIYRVLADTFAVQGNTQRRLAMFERIVDLAPDDVDSRLLFATELDENGDVKGANEQLLLVLETLFAQKAWKRYATTAHRYLERVPDDLARQEALQYAESALRDTASGVTAAVRTGEQGAVGDAQTTSSRGVGTSVSSSKVRESHIEALLDRPVSESLVGDHPNASADEDNSEAQLLDQLASIAPVVPPPLPRATPTATPPQPPSGLIPALGELGKFASRPFGPSSEVLLSSPGHVVAAALRARKRGDAVLALALLEDEGADEYPIASAFEKGVALAKRQQWGAAMGMLSDLMNADIAPADLALISYHLGVISEMTHDTMLAQVCFERVERLCPGEAEDVPGRLERLG